MDVWWDINGLRNDEYYSFYPVETKKTLTILMIWPAYLKGENLHYIPDTSTLICFWVPTIDTISSTRTKREPVKIINSIPNDLIIFINLQK